ncbi:hypothetical protein [Halorientalis salina]|uniref:hypothetical protein n=1 Tax=Halorientalis salina TaxID=2932266 RepID=UPI0010AC6F19|nr:hypothetical protein [Halorientalis salina]
MDWDLFPAFVLCVVGLGAVIGAFVAFPNAGQVEYYHSVERVSNDTVPNDSRPLASDDLSPEARAVFRDARNAPDDEAIVTDPEQKPPEFEYVGDQENVYYVRDDGSYYQLRTGKIGGGPLAMFGLAVKGFLGISGLALLGIGGDSLRRRELQTPLATLGILIAFVSLVAVNWILDQMLGVLLPIWAWAIAIALAVIVPIKVTGRVVDQSSAN